MAPSAPRFLVFGTLLATLMIPVQVAAMCCPMPCDDCEIRSRGQLNLVIMDRDAGVVRLIPNIRITGVADDFALILPTPSMPEFREVDGDIWNEVLALTAPVRPQQSTDGGLGCGTSSFTAVSAITPGDEADRGVTVIGQETVGDFIATIITSDDPDALVTWLNENNFSLDTEDAAKFTPYIEANWVFTTMRLAPEVEAPPAWDISVDPVEIVFEATNLEVPLPILSINRSDTFPMVFFVVDDHRMTFPDFTTTYANRISSSEYKAIRVSQNSLTRYLEPGCFLTRLDREFLPDSPMNTSVVLTQYSSDREVTRILGSSLWGSFPVGLCGLALLFLGAWRLTRRVQA